MKKQVNRKTMTFKDINRLRTASNN
jgi:hypothetical protein